MSYAPSAYFDATIGVTDDDMPHELLHAPDVPLRMQRAVREVDELPAVALAPEQCFQRGWVVLPRNHHIWVDARDFPRQVLRNLLHLAIQFGGRRLICLAATLENRYIAITKRWLSKSTRG